MSASRVKSGLAVVGGCAALSVVAPPLAGLLNALGCVTLLALAGYAAYRGWAFMESVVEASRRPTTVRRNLDEVKDRRGPVRSPARSRTGAGAPEHEPPERELRVWAGSRRPRGSDPAELIRSR
jgi:membrane protein implicated in regulation of membrane protease activity